MRNSGRAPQRAHVQGQTVTEVAASRTNRIVSNKTVLGIKKSVIQGAVCVLFSSKDLLARTLVLGIFLVFSRDSYAAMWWKLGRLSPPGLATVRPERHRKPRARLNHRHPTVTKTSPKVHFFSELDRGAGHARRSPALSLYQKRDARIFTAAAYIS